MMIYSMLREREECVRGGCGSSVLSLLVGAIHELPNPSMATEEMPYHGSLCLSFAQVAQAKVQAKLGLRTPHSFMPGQQPGLPRAGVPTIQQLYIVGAQFIALSTLNS
jgi:hypothetical protein